MAVLPAAGRSAWCCTAARTSRGGRKQPDPGSDGKPAEPVRRATALSSHAIQALDAWGLSFLQAISPGVALCRLHSEQAALEGMEVVLMGGQMGSVPLFETLRHGS